MRTLSRWSRFAAVAALFGAAGCPSLDVQNPNNPDAERAFSDPGAVAGLITGAIRNWVQTRQNYDGSLVLSAMADAYSSSWNNWELNYHTSYGTGGGADANGGGSQFGCTFRCAFANSTSAAGTRSLNIEIFWYAYYGLLSSVNDVLKAIRQNGVLITSSEAAVSDQANTDRHEAAAVMMQGVVFANIALNYDRGFIVDEATDISDPASLPLVPREEMRDAAITKFDEAIALMTANPFTSRAVWLGAPGPTYTSAQLIQLIRTMQAELLAYFPRSAEEDATVNWAQVRTYAAAGMSSGAPFDFSFFVDNVNMDDGLKDWGNAATLVKVDTRLANIITAGPNPALRHPTPWNGTAPQPNAFDARVGDGSWGPVDDFFGDGTVAETPNAGSDFAYTAAVYLNPSRGLSHFGNLAHIRYSYVAYPGYGLPGEDGTGLAPTYTATLNDLLWAEGELRGGGSPALAAQKINNTRVNRGGLSQLTGAEGQAALIAALQYESELELLAIGPSPFYNRRRGTPAGWQLGQACPAILCLWPETPRQMPIPAKELAVLQQELYTFGGSGNPAFAPSASIRGVPVWSAAKIADAMRKQAQIERRRRR
jgi:hypothetical protein